MDAAILRAMARATDPDGYTLLDAGDGRRLERFGRYSVDRPAPAADAAPRDARAWPAADLRFVDGRGWVGQGSTRAGWEVMLRDLRLACAAGPAGGLGVFPEHALHGDWLASAVATRARLGGPAVLHLFAHTGLLTLEAARAGATVAHVDAARSAVNRARENAARNGLAARPIRWLVDDAVAFIAREARRGRRYDVIVLDPPTWGHGPAGRPWRLDDGLAPLLRSCRAVAADAAAVLLTAHTPGWDGRRLGVALTEAFGATGGSVEVGAQRLMAISGAVLDLGGFARLGR